MGNRETRGGLRVRFDAALDAGAWPGPLAGRDAYQGEAWLGPLGLLERLELELGLGGPRPSAAQRAAELARELRGVDGFWSASLEADPLGTARRLLLDRDLLAAWGWRGERASARLDALWRATERAAPGVPDRLRDAIAALARHGVDLESVQLHEPASELPALWRALLEALERGGAAVEVRPLEPAPARGDLLAARGRRFAPRGDDTLVLYRPHGALRAADEVAAALASAPSLDDVVVVGADGVLADALTRHGLPRPRAVQRAAASGAILPLVVETAFAPVDPAHLHALVCLDPGPVPRAVAVHLARALQSFPGRGSQAWREALAAGLETLAEERRAAVAARLDALLAPLVEGDAPLSIDALRARLAALSSWARGRVADAPSLAATVQAADALADLARRLGVDALPAAELRRLLESVDARVPGPPAEAGLASVPAPDGVLGRADTTVWWSFDRESAPRPQRIRLSAAERAALLSHGVTPPDAGRVMGAEARRWRRPLELSAGALVLVCPQTDDAGEARHPHPLWDELVASMEGAALAARLERRELCVPSTAPRARASLRPLPQPALTASAGRPLALRERESPSSLEKLLSCSLAWALQHHGRVRRGLSHPPPAPTPLLLGSLAHHFLARVLEHGAPAPDEAARRADELLDAELGALCETLALPRHQVERAELRRAVVESARGLAGLVAETGATLRGVEVRLERDVDGLAMCGYADLLLASPDAVLDLKWGVKRHRERLEAGAALQLAAYAEMSRDGGRSPEVGYWSLTRQRLLTAPPGSLPGARAFGTAGPADTWRAALAALAARREELARGALAAPGATGAELRSSLDGGTLALAPACDYCDLGGLCGRKGGT